MRIVSGIAGGIRLLPPPAPARPTMDLVRGAVFSILGVSVKGAQVLDLFAGSGSYALEAMSRGAAAATAVERDRRALEMLRRNSQKTGLDVRIVAGDAFDFLRRAPAERFDLVFADPPYKKSDKDEDFAARLLGMDELHNLLRADGFLILETFRGWTMPRGATAHWEESLVRCYGDAAIHLLRPVPKTPAIQPVLPAESL